MRASLLGFRASVRCATAVRQAELIQKSRSRGTCRKHAAVSKFGANPDVKGRRGLEASDSRRRGCRANGIDSKVPQPRSALSKRSGWRVRAEHVSKGQARSGCKRFTAPRVRGRRNWYLSPAAAIRALGTQRLASSGRARIQRAGAVWRQAIHCSAGARQAEFMPKSRSRDSLS